MDRWAVGCFWRFVSGNGSVFCRPEIDFLLTGEIKYHDMLSMAGLGIACVACGHDTSERVVLEPLAKQFKMDDVAPKIEVYGGLNYNNIVF